MSDSTGAVDFDTCNKNAHLVKKKLNVLNTTMRKMITNVSNVGDSFESVARCYVDITGVAVTRRGYGEIPVSTESRVELNNTAKLLVTEMQNMLDSDAIKQYQDNVYRRILDRMHPLRALSKRAVEAGRQTKETLKRYERKKEIVDAKVKKYAKKNKPISASKRYEKQVEECDAARLKWHEKLKLFNEKYAELMAAVEKAAGGTLDQFLDINYVMLQSILTTICDFALNAARVCPTASHVLTAAIHNSMAATVDCEAPPRTTVSRLPLTGSAPRPAPTDSPAPLYSSAPLDSPAPRDSSARRDSSGPRDSPAPLDSSGPREDPYAVDHRVLSPEPAETVTVSSFAPAEETARLPLEFPPPAEVTATVADSGTWGHAESDAATEPRKERNGFTA